MACKILLISIQDVEINCNVSLSVDSDSIDVRTNKQQQVYIKQLLGKAFYNALLDEVENSTVSTVNQLLIDVIKPYLSWLTYADYIPRANVNSGAAGLFKNVDPNYTLADKEELGSMAKDAYGFAQVEKLNVIELLKENKSDYPLWVDDSCNKDRSIQGYSISAIGGRQNKQRIINVYDNSRRK